MEGLERLIGRSIGGKVTTSVEMERTTHSKSNALALAFSQMFHCKQMHNFVYCQKRRLASKSYSSFGINWPGSELLKCWNLVWWSWHSSQMNYLKRKFILRPKVLPPLPRVIDLCVVKIKLWFMQRLNDGLIGYEGRAWRHLAIALWWCQIFNGDVKCFTAM